MRNIFVKFSCLIISAKLLIVHCQEEYEKTLFCNITSTCKKCAKVEERLEYCKSTGFRERLQCIVDKNSSQVSYQWKTAAHQHGSANKHQIGDKFQSGRPCSTAYIIDLSNSRNMSMSVIQFELIMLVIFICALPVYLWRKRAFRL